MNPLVRLDIFDDIIHMTEFKDDAKKVKFISAEALSTAVSNNLKLDTGFLPTIHGIVRYMKNNGMIYLYYQIPEHRREIIYDDMSSGKYNAILPWTLFVFGIRLQENGSHTIVRSRVFALKGPILTSLDSVYRYPLTNVNDDGSLCWGNHRMPTGWKNLTGLSGFVEQFFSSYFNAHLDHGNFIPTELNINNKKLRVNRVQSLLGYLGQKTVTTFPYEVLKHYCSVSSIQERIKEI